MKVIALTQRVYCDPTTGERRDCLDQRWAAFVSTIGMVPFALCNRASALETLLDSVDLAGVILTGGNDLSVLAQADNPAPERDEIERALISASIARGLPVLGVCRGMQMLNVYFGGSLEKISDHTNARHEIHGELGRREVNSYHGFGIYPNNLASSLCATATSEDRSIEAFRHESMPLIGSMWHPEREKPFSRVDIEFTRSLFAAKQVPA